MFPRPSTQPLRSRSGGFPTAQSFPSPSLFKIPCSLFIILFFFLPRLADCDPGGFQSQSQAEEKPFSRQELWVPATHLGAILKKNPKAVLLTRAQYETLLKDAESHFESEAPDKEEKSPPPTSAIRNVSIIATPEGDAIRLVATYTVESPSTGWTELPLALDPQYLASVEVDGLAALRPLSPPVPAPAAPQNQSPPVPSTPAPPSSPATDPSLPNIPAVPSLPTPPPPNNIFDIPSPSPEPQTPSPSPQPPILVLRGPDESSLPGTTVTHHITLTSILPLRQNGAGASFQFTPPNAAAASLTLTLPPNAKLDSELPFTLSEDKSTATVAISGSRGNAPLRIGWSSQDIAPLAGSAIFQKGRYLYSIDPVRVHADLGFVLSSSLRDLPEALEVNLPPAAKILAVEGTDVLAWDADEPTGTISITMVPGSRRATDIRILAETPAIAGAEDESETSLPRPEVAGVHRASGTFAIFGSPEIRIRSIGTGPLTIQSHGDLDEAILDQPGFVAGFRFPSATGDTTVRLQRLRDRFTADLDTQITLQREAIYITRTAAIVPAEGQLFETKVTLPPNEEIISVLLEDGTEPAWKHIPTPAPISQPQDPKSAPSPISHLPSPADTVRISWPTGLQVGTTRTLIIKTRRDPAGWFDLDQAEKPLSLQFQSATLQGAEKVAGYIAVDFGPSFQVHTATESGLERRFAGTGENSGTPVKGQLAWFRLREFDLKLDVSRRPPDVEAEIIAYALPLAGTLEIEGQINLAIGLTPLQKLELALPPDVAEHLRLDSHLISEKTLDPKTGRWLFRFHRDLEGNQSLRFRLNLPFNSSNDESKPPAPISQLPAPNSPSPISHLPSPAGPARQFATSIPPISIPGAKRLRGWWLIEANTDTELTFAPEGLDESDALRVPVLPGYTPRHRVIAAYQFRGSEYTLAITGKRHTPEALVSTVVEMLTIDSVLSADGISRHQILAKVRSAGEQFFEITLPSSKSEEDKSKATPADLWTLAVDGIAVKPVRGRDENSLRIALPDSASSGRPVLVKLVYQTSAPTWATSGDRALQPPTFAKGVPILDSSWRLHLPEGYSYRDFDSNLHPRFETKTTPLISLVTEKLTPRPDRRIVEMTYDAEWEPQPGAINTYDAANPGGGDGSGPSAAEREIVRRAENIPEAEAHIANGDAAFVEKNWEQAIADYGVAIEKLPNAPATQALKDLAIAKFADASINDAKERAEGGHHDEARQTLRSVLSLNPDHLQAKTLLSHLDDPDQFPPALTPGHVLDAQDVERLLKMGISFYDLGDFDNARDQFWEVLRIDRYNTAARRMLEKVEQRIIDYQLSTRDHTRTTRQREVDEMWETQVPLVQQPGGNNDTAYVTHKLNTIILPRVQFTDARIDEAIEFLVIKTRSLDNDPDPEMRGLSMILKADAETVPRISLDLENVPLIEALRYVTELAGMKFRVEPYAILIVPLTDVGEIYQQTFSVHPEFLSLGDGTGLPPKATSQDILAARGITSPEGTSSFFNPVTSQLIVNQTAQNMALVEAFINSLSAAPNPNQPSDSPSDPVDPFSAPPPRPTGTDVDSPTTDFDINTRGERKAGLIPLDFDLPDEGVTYTFEGLYAPAALEFEFVAWEREIRVGWLWIALGAILYFFLAFDRPIFLGLFVALILAFLPTAIWQSSTLVFNAILIGWLGAMAIRLLTRLFQKFESRRRPQPSPSHVW